MSADVLRPVGGDGVLARRGSLVLLMSTPPGAEDLVSALLAAQEDVARSGGDGNALTERLGGVLAGSAATLDLVAFGPAGPSLAIVVYGHAFADVSTAQGEQRLALRQSRDGVRSVLPGQLISIRAGLGDPSQLPPHRFGSLDHGVVAAGGLVLDMAAGGAGAPAAPAAAPSAPAAPPMGMPPVPPVSEAPAPAMAQPAGPEAPPAADVASTSQAAADMPAPPPPVQAAGADMVLQTDAPAEAAPAAEPVGLDLHKEIAEAPAGEPAVPDAAPPVPVAAEAPPAAPQMPPPAAPQMPPPVGQPSAGQPPVGQPPAGQPPVGQPPVGQPAAPAAPAPEMPLIMPPPDTPPEQLGMPAPSGPTPQFDRNQPFEAVNLLAPMPEAQPEERTPLPVAAPLAPAAPDVAPAAHEAADDSVQVLGVYCKNGHFDDPAARYCAICGIGMAQQTLIPRLGPRPPLGVLVLDDGSIFSLDRDYVIGREPQRDTDVQNGSARPMRIEDPYGQLSRVHLRIHLEGWQVEVVDLGSANGTGIWRPGDTQWTRVPPNTRIPIRPGTQVGFGRNQLRFESHTNT